MDEEEIDDDVAFREFCDSMLDKYGSPSSDVDTLIAKLIEG